MGVIRVEQTQTKDGLKVILHRLEYTAEWIAAFLTVENTDNHYEIEFISTLSIATQGDYESKVTFKGPNYRSLENIKYGAKQHGAVKFEGLPYDEPTITFEFWFSKYIPNRLFYTSNRMVFVFEV
jgi:hypothetical protein